MTSLELIAALEVGRVAAWARWDAADILEDKRGRHLATQDGQALTLAIASVRPENFDALRAKVAVFREIVGSNISPDGFDYFSACEQRLGQSILADLVRVL